MSNPRSHGVLLRLWQRRVRAAPLQPQDTTCQWQLITTAPGNANPDLQRKLSVVHEPIFGLSQVIRNLAWIDLQFSKVSGRKLVVCDCIEHKGSFELWDVGMRLREANSYANKYDFEIFWTCVHNHRVIAIRLQQRLASLFQRSFGDFRSCTAWRLRRQSGGSTALPSWCPEVRWVGLHGHHLKGQDAMMHLPIYWVVWYELCGHFMPFRWYLSWSDPLFGESSILM